MDIRRTHGTQLVNDRTGEVIYTPPDGEARLCEMLANWERFLHGPPSCIRWTAWPWAALTALLAMLTVNSLLSLDLRGHRIMATLTIRNLDERLKRALRLRAAGHGRSMEQEARVILADALATPRPDADGSEWLQRVRQRFHALEGDDWSVPSRHENERELPRFDA